MTHALVPPGRIERRIIVVRGENVMLDDDLARIYGVETRVLVQAVKRSARRFPSDFMFQLSREEFEGLRAQLGGANPGRGGRRYLPHAFTEQGVAMLSSVLRSDRAVHVSIEIVRAFVRLRRMAGSIAELRRKVDALEQKYDAQFRMVFDAIRELMAPPAPGEKRRIGFRPESPDGVRAARLGR
jgi:ORF6N domain